MNVNLFNPQRKYIVSLVNIFLIISVLYFFSSIYFGLDFTDSFYHLNQALDPADGIYLYPFFLSSVIIKGIIYIIGPEVIYLRFFNSLLLWFSLLIPFLLIKIDKPRTEVLFYMACGLFLFTPFNVNILGYDSISIFILSLIFSLSVVYLQKANFYLLLLLSLICALGVLIRLPNVLVIPIVFFVIVFSGRVQKGIYSVKFPVIYLLITICLILFGFSIYYINLKEFLGASANSSSHDLKMLFYNYLQHGLKILPIISLILGGYFIFKAARDKFPKYIVYFGAGLSFMVVLGLFVIRSKYSQNYSFFLTSLALSLVIDTIIQERKNWLSLKNLVLFLFILFLFINPFGSNTGLLKATSLFLLLPFVLNFSKVKPDSYWILILIVLLPFSFIEKLSGTYEDKGIPALNSKVDNILLNPIRTTEIRATYLKNIDVELKDLKINNVEVYFYGDKSHIFHYLYPETAMNIDSFFQPVDNLEYYPQIIEKLRDNENVAIFIADSYPGVNVNNQHLLEIKLLNDGFKRIKMESLEYFLKTNNSTSE